MKFGSVVIAVIFVGLLFTTQKSAAQAKDLDYYLSVAHQNSPLLKDYANQAASRKLDSLLIMANKKISVDATGAILIAPIISGYGYDEAITNKGQYTAIAGVNKTLFQKNEWKARAQESQLEAGIISNASKISARDLDKAVTDQYLNTYSISTTIDFEKQTIASLENQLLLLQPLVNHGIYQQTDYLTLKLQVETEKIVLLQLKSDYRSNLYVLHALSGIADTAIVAIEKPNLTWQLPSTGINPNLALFSLDSLSAETAKDLLRYNYVPKAALFGDAGYNAIPADFSAKKFGFSAGITVSWNIYDGGKKNLQWQQWDLKQATAGSYKEHYQKSLSMQLSDLEKQFSNSNSIVEQLQKQQADMNQLLLQRRVQLETGQISVIDYLSVIRDHRELQRTLNNAWLKQQQIINEHNYLIW